MRLVSCRERGGKLVAAFSETRSGLKSAGKQLREALRTCRMRRAILIVAAIDRLSRRAALITAIMDSDIELAVVDSPATDRVVLHVKAAWAEQELVQMSTRIKAALAEAKKRGKKLGGPPLKDMRRIAKLAQAGMASPNPRTRFGLSLRPCGGCAPMEGASRRLRPN